MAVEPTSFKLECCSCLSHCVYLVADRWSENVWGCFIVPSCATVQELRVKPTTNMPWARKTDEVSRLTHYHVIRCIAWNNGDRFCCSGVFESKYEPCLRFVVARLYAFNFFCNCKRSLGGWHSVPIHMCNRGTSSIRVKVNRIPTIFAWDYFQTEIELKL